MYIYFKIFKFKKFIISSTQLKMFKFFLIAAFLLIVINASFGQNKIIVYQTDFGLKDGAVAEMKGVAMNVSTDLKLFDLTHEIPAFDIWEAAYRLEQTVRYWPSGTVFVSVVDPGVGTARKSVVLKTKSGHFIVSPDNGTLTLIVKSLGISAIREIDEKINRRKDSQKSNTFFGRDVYSFTAARLASGVIAFEQVGPLLQTPIVTIPFQEAVADGKKLRGNIPVLDVQYGNIWTNIPDTLFNNLKLKYGEQLNVSIFHKNQLVYSGKMPYTNTFGAVAEGKPLAYINSLLNLSFAINMGDFAKTNNIASGNEWNVEVSLP